MSIRIRTPNTDLPVMCRICKDTHILRVHSYDLTRWQNGEYVQNAFRYLSADERELLVSNTCPSCWDKIFPDKDEY